jgi:hypothetical protein
MLKATIDGSAVRRAIADLKEVDPKLYTALRSGMRTGLQGPANAIQNGWPASVESPSGMNRLGRAGYAKPSTSVAFTPGFARRGQVSSIIAIKVKIPEGSAGAWIGEMAGMRGDYATGRSRNYSKNGSTTDSKGKPYSHELKGQGKALVEALNQQYGSAVKGGRWGWRKFVNIKSNIQNIGINILEKELSILNRGK